MINCKASISKALDELRQNQNNAVAYIFQDPKFMAGPLQGATITIKDLFATKEGTTQGSSKILEDFAPHYDASVIKKINQSGAAIIAKVHSDELGLGGTGEFSAYGMITHSLDKQRMIGGSSSGSVATFTKHISLALGTDTGNSIRLPASYNGFVGFKPSYGAISRFGVFAYASSLDTVGMIAHNVHDVIEFAKVTFGQDPLDLTTKALAVPEQKAIKPRRVAILKDEDHVLHPQAQEKFRKLIHKLTNEGICVQEVMIDINLLQAIEIVYLIISYSEASSNDANLNGIAFGKRVAGKNWEEIMTNTRTHGFGKMVQQRFTLGAFALASANQKNIFIRAQKVRRLITEAFNQIYDHYDVLMFPSTEIAPLLTQGQVNNWYASYLIASNLVGNPSISIPFAHINKLPFGINLDAQLYSDKQLLSYALYLEKIIAGGDFDES